MKMHADPDPIIAGWLADGPTALPTDVPPYFCTISRLAPWVATLPPTTYPARSMLAPCAVISV